MKRHRLRRCAWIDSLKVGVPCARCGGEFPTVCMDWHHKDKSTKDFKIAQAILKPLEKIIEELKKCELLCANCHRIVTANGE